MKKLKLDELQVTSFATSQAAPRARGTVQAHAGGTHTHILTYSIEECGDTNYMDCTMGCSLNTLCANYCILM